MSDTKVQYPADELAEIRHRLSTLEQAHGDRLSEHDRRLSVLEGKIDRVVERQTADSLVLQGLDFILRRVAAKIGADTK